MGSADTGRTLSELGNYILVSRLGEENGASVYKAKNRDSGEIVALKAVPRPRNHNEETLFSYANAASTLNHPSIVKIIDFGEDKGYVYVVMEYLEWQSLDNVIKWTTKLPEKEALKITVQLAEALTKISEAKIRHGNIKPTNILISKDGVAKLTDLRMPGVRDRVVQNNTPPEVLMDGVQPDIRSDIYALGVTFYHMVTGSPPYNGSPDQIRASKLNGKRPDPRETTPELSGRICQIIQKMMVNTPQDRYQTLDELLDDLKNPDRKPKTQKLPASPPPPRETATRPPTRKIPITSKLKTGSITSRSTTSRTTGRTATTTRTTPRKTNPVPIIIGVGALVAVAFVFFIAGGTGKLGNVGRDVGNPYEQDALDTLQNARAAFEEKRWRACERCLQKLNTDKYIYTNVVSSNADEIMRMLQQCKNMLAEDDSEVLFGRAEEYFKAGNFSDAKTAYNDLLTEYRDTKLVREKTDYIKDQIAKCEEKLKTPK